MTKSTVTLRDYEGRELATARGTEFEASGITLVAHRNVLACGLDGTLWAVCEPVTGASVCQMQSSMRLAMSVARRLLERDGAVEHVRERIERARERAA